MTTKNHARIKHIPEGCVYVPEALQAYVNIFRMRNREMRIDINHPCIVREMAAKQFTIETTKSDANDQTSSEPKTMMISMNDILNDPTLSQQHTNRIRDAYIRQMFVIEIEPETPEENRTTVPDAFYLIDDIHRLARLIQMGETSIIARTVYGYELGRFMWHKCQKEDADLTTAQKIEYFVRMFISK